VRALVLALLLAAACGAALLWQREHYAAIRVEQRALQDELDGIAAPTPSGTLEAGRAVLVIGRGSGAEAVPRPQPLSPPAAAPLQDADRAASGDPDLPLVGQSLGEMELEVQPGQTLSGLAHLYYGEHGSALLRALAEHNGLANPDSLQAGALLRLPARDVLLP